VIPRALRRLGEAHLAEERPSRFARWFFHRHPTIEERLADGRIMGCAGLMVQAPWVADGWMLPTPLIAQYPIAFHKLVKESFGILVKSLGLRRVQVAVDSSMPRRCVWIERMGFQREGLMRRFGSLGEDMYLYALLIGD